MLGLFHARKLRLHQLAIEHARLGRAARPARHHQALLRPLHAGDLRARLRAAARRARAGRSTCSPCCGHEPAAGRARRRGRTRRAGGRPAHPHALRRGLRHVAVRRGVAVGGDRLLLPAAARRARRRAGARDAVGHAGPRRPARGARRARPLPDVPARDPAGLPRARPAGGHARGGGRARALRRGLRAGGGRARAAATCAGGSPATRPGPPRRRTPCSRCSPRTRGSGCSSPPGSRRTVRASGGWGGGFWLPECAHAPWLDPLLAEAGARDRLRRPHRRRARRHRARCAPPAGPCSSRSTGRRSSSCGAATATPREARTATRTG